MATVRYIEVRKKLRCENRSSKICIFWEGSISWNVKRELHDCTNILLQERSMVRHCHVGLCTPLIPSEMIRKTDLLTKKTKVTQEDSKSYTCRLCTYKRRRRYASQWVSPFSAEYSAAQWSEVLWLAVLMSSNKWTTTYLKSIRGFRQSGSTCSINW